MAQLFSENWMNRFREEWNKEPELAGALRKINFDSVIAYGFDDEEDPRGVIMVRNGEITAAGAYNGEAPNWDLRASPDNWQKWFAKEVGIVGIAAAYTTSKLKFITGDYSAMIRDPRMAAPFIKSFTVMGRASR
jgi:putative sterol carrier protein